MSAQARDTQPHRSTPLSASGQAAAPRPADHAAGTIASRHLRGGRGRGPDNTRPGRAVARRPSFGVMDVIWFLPRLMLRLFFPRLVDRYVIGELLAPLA